MRLPAVLILAAFALPGAAGADLWQVGPLPPGDALNVRSGPAPSFPATARLGPATGSLDRRARIIGDLPGWVMLSVPRR